MLLDPTKVNLTRGIDSEFKFMKGESYGQEEIKKERQEEGRQEKEEVSSRSSFKQYVGSNILIAYLERIYIDGRRYINRNKIANRNQD